MSKKDFENFEKGKKVFAWDAHDYHPHERGLIWMSVFCTILFGGAIWAYLSDPQWGWLTSFSFFIAAAVYFLIHRNGNQGHEVQVFENGLFIDEKVFFPWSEFNGFWFVYDPTVAVVNFDFINSKKGRIILQLGELTPEDLRKKLSKITLEEKEDQKEALIDLWVRALKL